MAGKPGTFRTDGVGKSHDVDLVPFYRLHRHVYMGYFDLYSPAEWAARMQEAAAELNHQRQLEAATIGYFSRARAAEAQFHQQGESTSIVRVEQRTGRTGRGWFSYDLPVDPAKPNVLVVTYHSDSRRPRTFDILVDGQPLAQEQFEIASDNRFVDREYLLPAAAVTGKQKVTIRFQATNGNDIAAVFGVRVIRR